MSNLADCGSAAALRRLRRSCPSLGIAIRSVLAAEQELLFDARTRLRGPRADGPERRATITRLAWRDNAQVLVRNDGGVELLSNICRHRQAIMLDGRGSMPNIVCPDPPLDVRPYAASCSAHRISPSNRASGCTARRCSTGTVCCSTAQRDVASDLAGMARARARSISQATCSTGSRSKECNYNWKTFIEVYLEDYHVEPFHPGLGQFVTCDDLDWQFGERYSLQTVGVNNALAKPGTKTLRALAQGGARLLRRRSCPRTARSG